MKTLISASLFLISLSCLGNDYVTRQKQVECEIIGDMQTMYLSKRALPNLIRFNIDVSEIRIKDSKKNEKIVSRKIISDIDQTPLTVAHAKIDYESYWDRAYVNLKLKGLTKRDSRKLLVQLGASESDVSGLKGRVESFKMKNWFEKSQRYQMHYDLNERDGLSFHIKITCREL